MVVAAPEELRRSENCFEIDLCVVLCMSGILQCMIILPYCIR